MWFGFVPGHRRRASATASGCTGPWDPADGLRYNPAKLLLDPYARAIEGDVTLAPRGLRALGRRRSCAATPTCATGATRAPYVPRCVVVDGRLRLGGRRRRPRCRGPRRWSTRRTCRPHPPATRTCPRSCAAPTPAWRTRAAVEHLTGLGVTTVELLPVHAFTTEPALVRRGPDATTGATTPSASSPRTPPTPPRPTRRARSTSSRTWSRRCTRPASRYPRRRLQPHRRERPRRPDAVAAAASTTAAYYRLDERGSDIDVTGCGNTLDLRHPRGLPDGPGLAALLGRARCTSTASGSTWRRRSARGRDDGYDPDHPFLVALRTDPVLSRRQADRRAVGRRRRTAGGPASSRRRSPSGTTASATASATSGCRRRRPVRAGPRRATASASWPPGWPARRTCSARATAGPLASVNFVTAHDGFTLRRPHGLRRTSTTRPTARTTATAPTTTGRGTTASRAPTDDADVLRGPPAVDAQPARHAAAVHRRADAHRRRRDRPHPARQQQRLLPGQRDRPGSTGTSTPLAARPARDHPRTSLRLRARRTRCCASATFFAGRPGRTTTAATDLAWFAADGQPMTTSRWDDPHAAHARRCTCDGASAARPASLLVVAARRRPRTRRCTLPGAAWVDRRTSCSGTAPTSGPTAGAAPAATRVDHADDRGLAAACTPRPRPDRRPRRRGRARAGAGRAPDPPAAERPGGVRCGQRSGVGDQPELGRRWPVPRWCGSTRTV